MFIMMAARSKDIGLRLSLAGNAGSNPCEGMGVCLLWELCVARGLCDGPISQPEESYRVCVFCWIWLIATMIPYTYDG